MGGRDQVTSTIALSSEFLQKECTPVLPILFNINTNILNDFLHKNQVLDFPGGLLVENLPACLRET